jgi:hypothetical protein
MANEQNLRSWQPAQSGNPNGKPKGTKHLSAHIRELLEDETFEQTLADGTLIKGAPIKAIIMTLLTKGVAGDLKAIDLIGKYGYGTKLDLTSDDKPLPTPIYGGLASSDAKRPLRNPGSIT